MLTVINTKENTSKSFQYIIFLPVLLWFLSYLYWYLLVQIINFLCLCNFRMNSRNWTGMYWRQECRYWSYTCVLCCWVSHNISDIQRGNSELSLKFINQGLLFIDILVWIRTNRFSLYFCILLCLGMHWFIMALH